NYTRFAYNKIDNYKWRTPFDKNKASYTEGLKSDLQDDKACSKGRRYHESSKRLGGQPGLPGTYRRRCFS
ncbi:MAG: hypothetical protein ACEQSN_11230, partial [Yersinia sp. (in: enterobacteria)]